jgi:S-adenosylmethionine uptake transporter
MITAAFRRASAAVIAPLDYTHMIWAVFYGWLFWGHLPDARTWVGTGIIVFAGLFVIYREQSVRRKQRKDQGSASAALMEPQVTLPDPPIKNTDR